MAGLLEQRIEELDQEVTDNEEFTDLVTGLCSPSDPLREERKKTWKQLDFCSQPVPGQAPKLSHF